MGRLLGYLQKTGMRKGFKDGNQVWLAVGIVAWGLTRLGKMAAKQEQVVFREPIRPGEKLIISYGGQTVEVDG